MDKELINEDGSVFTEGEIESLVTAIDSSDTDARKNFRDLNSTAIAYHLVGRMLIVAGPGTGKSYLFMDRIRAWTDRFPDQRIYVSSFVRKLVLDLESDVASSDLSDETKSLVTISTLHSLARSVVERNGGTLDLPMAPHIRMIGQEWKELVWLDVLWVYSGSHEQDQTAKELEKQYHDLDFIDDSPWPELRRVYERLCRFYNALGFADSIVLASTALAESPELSEDTLWIFDEFQDFNVAEENLVKTCIQDADGVLLAGDDDQALYQNLKGSHPDIIRSWYEDPSIVNAMLPLCGRSSYHICMAATHFLQQRSPDGRIDKVYRPLDTDPRSTKIQVVAASASSTATGYVTQFIQEHRERIEARESEIRDGVSKDPYLLVLSLQKDISGYLGEAGNDLAALIEEWRLEETGPGEDYRRVRTYYRQASFPFDNFTLRKILHFENVPKREASQLVLDALEAAVALVELEDEVVDEAQRKCGEIATIVDNEEIDSTSTAEALAGHVRVDSAERLAIDLDQFPIARGISRSEEDEEVEAVRTVSPVELLTMIGAKGLSADHVIILGADNVNMGHASTELFFVALTRARQSLHVVIPLGARGAEAPHDFVMELPEQHCTYSKFLAAGRTEFAGRAPFVDYINRRRTRIRNAR